MDVSTPGYDSDGNVTSMEDANSNTTTASFNSLGQPLSATDALSHSTSTSYDNWGRVSSVTTPAGTTSKAYDPDSNATSVTDPNSHTTTTTFDNDCRPLLVTKANGDTFTYVYDGTGQKGLLSYTTDGNGHTTYYSYDSLNRKTSVSYPDSTSESWGYDAASNITSHTDGNGYTVNYSYDNAGKLTSVTYPSGTGAGTGYSYDAHDKLTSAGSKSYGYDSNGNCTSVTVGSSVTSINYDIENRVIGITYPEGATNSFAYNGEDLRTQKVDSTGTQNYVTDGSSPGSALLKDGNAVYTPGLSEHRGSTSKFYHGDALGSTRGITDGTQSVTDSQLFDAFGNTVSRTGTTPTPFGFVGKQQYQSDSDSSLQLLGHRYYDPSIGRFLSSDPAKAGTNWYAYCYNNPLNQADPLGLDPPPGSYGSLTEAVDAIIAVNQPLSDADGREHGGWIIRDSNGNYLPIYRGKGSDHHIDLGTPPEGAAGSWHTHPQSTWDPVVTDPLDQNLADITGVPAFAGQSNGWIAITDPRKGHKETGQDTIPWHLPILIGVPNQQPGLPNVGIGETIGRAGIWKIPPSVSKKLEPVWKAIGSLF